MNENPPHGSDEARAAARRRYWRAASILTTSLLVAWFLVTFGILYFARELADIHLFGWPFSFYMAAQGLTLFYLLLVAVYVLVMRYLDYRLGGDDVA